MIRRATCCLAALALLCCHSAVVLGQSYPGKSARLQPLVDAVGYDNMAALADQLALPTLQYGRKMFEEAHSKIAAGISADVPLAHKTGENGPVSHDIGYLLSPGNELALVIFAETSTTTDFDTAQALLNPLVAQVAGMVYDETRQQ